MWKQKILLLCLLIFLTGCGKNPGDYQQDGEGVYYQKISEKEIGVKYNSLAQYTRSLLYYKDRIYTSNQRYSDTDQENLHLGDILGNELAVIKGNHGVFWSPDEEKLSEITGEGTVYQVKGYDESFCVAVYYEIPMPLSETVCQLIIFEQLNDLTLRHGKELFEERLHLEEAVRIEGTWEKADSKCELSIESAEVREFLEALYDGIFLDVAGEEYPALKQEESGILSFYAPNSLITDIRVYEEGYVTMERGAENVFCIKVDGAKCKSIMDILSD